MRKVVFIAVIMLFAFSTLKAEEMSRVPKKKAFEVGYRYISTTTFDVKNQGVTLMFDYAWQLSGFTGKPAAYLSVPIGYTYLYGGDGSKTGGILSYGWTVRHNLKNWGSGTPFFGYALLLNQLSIQDREGKVFGHQTRFDFGYTFNSSAKLNPFVKLEYSMTRFPSLDKPKADKMYGIEFKAGVRF